MVNTRLATCLLAVACSAAAGAGEPAYVVDNYRIEQPLSAAPGDAARGAVVAVTRSEGNCLTCHEIPGDYEFPGTVGPSLVGVARRLDAAQLRLRLVDPKQLNPMTVMPAYFRSTGLYRVAPEYAGKTILTAQQVEDVIAFLLTLR